MLTPQELSRLKGLQHDFPGLTLELMALIKSGYSDSDIRRILNNIRAEIDKKGGPIKGALLFAVMMPQNQWTPTQSVYLDQVSWDHILNGEDPVLDPGHREDYYKLFGINTEDQISGL